MLVADEKVKVVSKSSDGLITERFKIWNSWAHEHAVYTGGGIGKD